jgi:hypothetical protein
MSISSEVDSVQTVMQRVPSHDRAGDVSVDVGRDQGIGRIPVLGRRAVADAGLRSADVRCSSRRAWSTYQETGKRLALRQGTFRDEAGEGHTDHAGAIPARRTTGQICGIMPRLHALAAAARRRPLTERTHHDCAERRSRDAS